MEEINLGDLFSYFFKKSPLIILIISIITILGIIYMISIQVPLYHGTTSIVLVQQSNETTGVTQSDLNVNEKLVSIYSEIIKSRRVLSQVINELNLDFTVSELAKNIQVTSLSNTPIIKISVSDENGEQAVKIANKTADIFSKEVVDIYNMENISILDEAIEEATPYNVNFTKQLVIYSAVGIVLGFGIVFAMYYFNDKINNKKEIETLLHLPVIGEIPIASKNNHDDRIAKKSSAYELVDETIDPKSKTEKKKEKGFNLDNKSEIQSLNSENYYEVYISKKGEAFLTIYTVDNMDQENPEIKANILKLQSQYKDNKIEGICLTGDEESDKTFCENGDVVKSIKLDIDNVVAAYDVKLGQEIYQGGIIFVKADGTISSLSMNQLLGEGKTEIKNNIKNLKKIVTIAQSSSFNAFKAIAIENDGTEHIIEPKDLDITGNE